MGRARAALPLMYTLVACGKPEPTASAPQPDVADEHVEAPATQPLVEAQVPAQPRLDAEVEFHRTRVALGPGFWALGMLHNQHAQALMDVRAQVRLLDAEGKLLARFETVQFGRVAAGASVPVAVLVDAPVEHEQLELVGSGVATDDVPTELPLQLEYDPPQHADLGGYFVVGQLTNTGTAAITDARLQVCGLDQQGRLLGVDWLELDPIPPGVSTPFDLGELRYEQTPARFELDVRGP